MQAAPPPPGFFYSLFGFNLLGPGSIQVEPMTPEQQHQVRGGGFPLVC